MLSYINYIKEISKDTMILHSSKRQEYFCHMKEIANQINLAKKNSNMKETNLAKNKNENESENLYGDLLFNSCISCITFLVVLELEYLAKKLNLVKMAIIRCFDSENDNGVKVDISKTVCLSISCSLEKTCMELFNKELKRASVFTIDSRRDGCNFKSAKEIERNLLLSEIIKNNYLENEPLIDIFFFI